MCAHHFKYKGKSNVVVDCTYDNIKFNQSIHGILWKHFSRIIDNKYPFTYLSNGSLLVKDLEVRSTYYFCEIFNKTTNETIHKCGTAITILKPLILVNTPKNETVDNNTLYSINCYAGGGDFSIIDLKYFINDVQVKANKPFRIVNDTKIECRVQSEQDLISVIAYIIVRRKGTEEDRFLQLECINVTSKVCDSVLFDKSLRLSNVHDSSRRIVEELLEKLFSTLDNSITLEYEEEKCVDRFKRFMCSTFYPRCKKINNSNFIKRLNCRESCESVFYVICRNALTDIDKQISSQSLQFINTYMNKHPYSQSYVAKFISNLTKSIMSCDQLPRADFRNQCNLVNLDIHQMIVTKDQSEKNCFNEIGRNYIGHYAKADSNTTCIRWDLIPQLYVSFYQQNLRNQSNYCRNPGGIYQRPVCAINLKKSGSTSIQNIRLIQCANLPHCKIDGNDPSQGKYNIILFTILGVVILIIIVVVIVIKCCAKIQYGFHKNIDSTEHIPLSNDEVNLFPNLVYKQTQNGGGFACPIYNAAHFEKVQALAVGEYGEIVLVQAVIDNISSLVLDESCSSNYDRLKPNKRQRYTKSLSESDTRSIDDLILSVDKTFNEKPCWPFDKSSPSGCCPFAVIKYLSNTDNDQKEARFNKETKILSQLNHPSILRFYGVCLHVSKVICRIVEYLPNGDIKSILTGTRREPPKSANHDSNNKIKNGYQSVNALHKSRIVKSDLHNMSDETKFFKRKNVSSQCREVERPQPVEHIDLTHKQLVKWGFEICDAIVYLHTKHLIHRDIATRNCLVGMNLEAKLSDFSFVQKFSYGFDLIGNPNEYIPIRWLPKETLENLVYNTDTDVWMFGVYLWELMSFGKEPYCDYDLHEVYDAIVADKQLENPENCPTEIYQQMELCFAPPRQRPCLETVKNSLIKIFNEL